MSLRKIQKLPELKLLRTVLDYSFITGELYWKHITPQVANSLGWSSKRYKLHNTRHAGNIAGHIFVQTSGARSKQIRFDGKNYYVHRIVYKWVTGIDALLIDHDDGDPLNNKFKNFNNVNNSINTKNCKLSVKNKSGHTGVSWSKNNYKWEAYIWKDNKKYNLGLYSDIEDAIAAREKKEVEFGYHKNHGRR